MAHRAIRLLVLSAAVGACATKPPPPPRAALTEHAVETAGDDSPRVAPTQEIASAAPLGREPAPVVAALDGAAAVPEPSAVCLDATVAPRQPGCRIDEREGLSGLRLGADRLKGKVRWCAGREPLPWISRARGAVLDASYAALGASVAAGRPTLALGSSIDDTRVILVLGGAPVLVSTAGTATPLRFAGSGAPANAIATGGAYPPTKGSVLRMPEGDEPIHRIDEDGTVTPIAPPAPGARFVGWSTSGGGHDSLWRSTRAEVWSVVHHGADGEPAGPPEVSAPPSVCGDDDVRLEDGEPAPPRFSWRDASGVATPGVRVAVRADGGLCLDHARGAEDRELWRATSDRPGGTERVTCRSWRLEAGGAAMARRAGSPAAAVATPDR